MFRTIGRWLAMFLTAIIVFPIAIVIGQEMHHRDLIGFGLTIAAIAFVSHALRDKTRYIPPPTHESRPSPYWERNTQRPTTTVPRRHVDPTKRTYGVAAAGISQGAATFGVGNTQAGREGEILSGQQLSDAQEKLSNIVVFHSLQWPGSSKSDIDHAVLGQMRNGSLLLLLVDSKRWKNGAYTWNGTMPMCNGEPTHPIYFSSGNPEYGLPSAADSIRRRFPGLTVRSVVAMHGASSVRTTGHPECEMIRGRDLSSYVTRMFASSVPLGASAQPTVARLESMLK